MTLVRSPLAQVPALLAACALLVTSAGCGKSKKTTGPSGDDSGLHLLAFATTRVSGTPAEYDVVIYDSDAGVYHSTAGLNAAVVQSQPCIADDGSVVAFASTRTGGAGGSDILIYDRLNQTVKAPANLNTAANETYPRFTHDNKKLAFVRDSAGVTRVRLYDGDTSALTLLPGIDSPGATSDDAPAPDLTGARIAFASNRSGAWHVYVWNSGSGVAATPALVGDTLDTEPSLSANGRWLAFASNRSGGAGGWDVYLYDLQSSAFVPLPRLNTAGDERHPTVNGDGTVLFFQSRPDAASRWSIWRYTLPDSNRVQPAGLPSAAGDDREPCLRWP